MRQWRIVHSESSQGWGGQEIRVFAELAWMRAQGHWVGLTADPESSIAQRARKEGMPFFPLRSHKAWLPLAVPELAAWLVKNQVEVVNTHSSNDGWVVGLAARLCRRPVIIRSRHIEVDYPNRFLSRISYGLLPDHVVTTSQRIAERLVSELSLRSSDVTCVATGVDLKKFDPALKGTLREELGLAPGVALVGMISVLRSWKGHATFLEAIARLGESSACPVHFVIAGDGPGRDELAGKVARNSAGKAVTLLGYRADVPNLLASLDLLVLPSYAHEGIPQIILQAQAMQRAVVASAIGGIPEVVEDGVTGLLVPPQDGAALAHKIAVLLQDVPLRERLGAMARRKIEEKYSLDAMGQRLLDLYASLSPG